MPSDHRNEDSLALSQEGISSDDFEDTFKEKEEGMEDEDFLLSALEQNGENKNESPRKQRNLEATLPSMVEINHNAPPLTVVEDQMCISHSCLMPEFDVIDIDDLLCRLLLSLMA